MEESKDIEVTYKFYIPEHNEDLRIFQNAYKMHSIIHEIDGICRSVQKYEDNASEDRQKLAEQIRDLIHSEIDLHG